MIPVAGEIKGLVEGIVGVDLTSNRLNNFDKTMIFVESVVGVFTIVDELADAAKLGRKLLAQTGDAAHLLKAGKGLGHLDEGVGVARSLRTGRFQRRPPLGG